MALVLGTVAFSGCGKKETESKYKIYYVNEEQGEVLAESFVPSEETTQTMLEEMTEKVNNVPEEMLCASTPGFDLRCIQHETLYSRLYMS